MTEKDKAAALREAAEASLRENFSARSGGVDKTELPRLLHELQVHQIELEMQNEQLQKAQMELEEARDKYFDLYELAPVGYITLDQEALIGSINLTGAKMFGIERSKLVHRHLLEFVSPSSKDLWHQEFLQFKGQAPDVLHSFDLEMVRADGSPFQAHLECMRREVAGASPVFRLALFDISKLKGIEANLRIAAAAFEAQEGMFVTDVKGAILRTNKAFSDITGYAAEEVIGKNPRLLQSGRNDADFYSKMWETIGRQGSWAGEIWNKRKNGEIYPVQLSITAVKNATSDVTHYVATFTDISESKASADTIEQLAFYDQLTGLPNRRLFLERLKQALTSSARNGKEGALLFIDLDNFKDINDTLGHDIGDLLLQQVANRLTSSVREGDTVSRIGGDEFLVMLEGLHENPHEAAAHAEMAAEKILLSLKQPNHIDSHECTCTASIGIALFSGHGTKVDAIMKQADIAMYQAKASGRNALRFYDPEMQASISAHVELLTNLRAAIPKQFQLYYQVQVDKAGHQRSAEALIRWMHPQKGIISPDAFIPLAEESGLILPIGLWVLKTACLQLKAWGNDLNLRHFSIAVNVSPKQFSHPDFVKQIVNLLDETGIDPALLKLELTESMLMENIEAVVEKMVELKAKGVLLSLDDFGTGFSSLNYLKHLPLDQLKIDQSFVSNVANDPSNAAIIRTVIALGQSLGFEVIAEGVETLEQRNFLADSGCNDYQGYLFSKPLPLLEFEQLLAKN